MASTTQIADSEIADSEIADTKIAGAAGAGEGGSRRRMFQVLLALYAAGGFVVAAWLCWRITHADLLLDQAVTGRWASLDWLTGYQAGFIRRGLAGAMILWFADLTRVSPLDLVFGVMLIAYAAQQGLIYGLIRTLPDASAALLIIFSPFLLGFELLTPGGVGRKDVLFITLLAGLGFFFARRKEGEPSFAPEIGLLALAALTLIHEAFFLYSPWVLAFGLMAPNPRPRLLRLGALWLLSAAMFALAVVFHGSSEAVSRICADLAERISTPGLDAACPSGGAIFALKQGAAEGWRHFRETYAKETLLSATPAVLLILVAFAPLAPFLARLRANRSGASLALIVCGAAALLMSLPLFVVADDWGRWIRLHAVAFAIALIALMARGEKEGWGRLQPATAALFRSPGFIAAAALYASFWELNIVGGLIGGGFIGRALQTFILGRG